jgi:hypothetical protein
MPLLWLLLLMVIKRGHRMVYNLGVITAPDFVTVQEDVEKINEIVDACLLKVKNLQLNFGTVHVHLTSSRKLDIGLASGCYHSEIAYHVYHPFKIKPTWFQTNTEANFQQMQFYSSGAIQNILINNQPFQPRQILDLWQKRFVTLDKLLYCGNSVYLEEIKNLMPNSDVEHLV